MANPIQLKRSKTAGNTPGTLADGEVAINIPDRKLYVNDGGGAVRTVNLLSDLEKAQVGNVLGAGVGLTVVSQGADQSGATDSTTAFSNAAASTAPHPVRLSPGTYRLAAGTYLGAKCIVADPGAALVKPDGTASDAYIAGGLQVSGILSLEAKTAGNTLQTYFTKTRMQLGTIANPSYQNSAPLDGNVLYHSARPASAQAYDVTWSAYYANVQYGTINPGSGSGYLFGGVIAVGDVAQETNGRSELTPISVFGVCDPAKNQYKTNLYFDYGFSGPVLQQESCMGFIFHPQKRNSSTTLDSDHSGADGYVCSTAPGGAGYSTPAMAAAQTYPLRSMFSACGFSGPQGTADGASSGATDAAQYAFLSGGGHGPWLNPFATSRFQYGFGATDWRDAGVKILGRHPSGTGPGVQSDYPIVAPNFTIDTNYFSQIISNNPVISWDANTLAFFDRTGKTYNWTIAGTQRLLFSATAFIPGVDNSMTLGDSAHRWSQVYAATTTINTSDAEQKANFRDPDEPLLLAALDTPLTMFQWKEAVSEKGRDGARWHFGPTAQGFRDACLARGFDPKRFGGYCEDPEVVKETKTRTIQRPVEEEVDLDPEPQTYVDEAGVARVRMVPRKGKRPKLRAMPVLDEAGQPVMQEGAVSVPDDEDDGSGSDPQDAQLRKRPKVRREVIKTPLVHYEPETETVEETYEEEVSTGGTVHGLRLDQFDRLLCHARWLVFTGKLTWTPPAGPSAPVAA